MSILNGYKIGQFRVIRVWPKWGIVEHGSDDIVRTVGVGTFWSWVRAARTAEIMRRIYCDGQDWDGNGPPRPESFS